MQVEHVEVSVVRVPPDAPYQASGRTVDAYWHVLARVRTRDGAAGFGYIVALNAALVQAVASACRELGEQLVGANVMEPEAAWERLYRRGSWSGPGGLLHFAIAPLDIALWDAAGKTLGQPLYRMLGGFRDRLPVYGSDGLWYNLSLDALAANARRYADRGFTAVKLRIGHETDPAKEVARVQAVRDACGPAMRVLVDATETWDLATALNTGYALQDAGIHWLEDPIHHDNVSGYANLCRQLRVRIATGEHIYTAAGFLRLFEQRGTTIALVDLGRAGGVTPWRRIAALAHAFDIPVCGHVLPELHVQLASAMPNGYLVEYVPRSAPILQAMPAVENGFLVAPKAPGLGLALDEDAVQRFTVR
jgi:L-alanine-DL-glutamate epimerase-like enolase superfamily enzyme